jgi:hypothetical protein
MLDRDLAFALDPVALFEAAVGGSPDPWQAALLRGSSPRVLVNCSRQSGKSTTSGVLAYHEALYRAPALVLLVAPSLRQSIELFRKVLEVHRAVGESVPVEAESALRLELKSGSRIVALPGSPDTLRGFSNVRLLILDEAARIDDDLVAACRPMLAVSKGRLLALTTPNGKRGFFHDAWQGDAGDGWERIRVTARDCPRISPEFLEEERRALGDVLFRQEYLTEFRESQGQIFSEDLIASLRSVEVEPLFPGSEWTLEPAPAIETRALPPSLIVDEDTASPVFPKES